MEKEANYAVLIDADNISPKYIDIIFDEAANYGYTTYRRIYGDWTTTRNSGWKDTLLENSITPIQQYSYTDGKNSTDSAMIIDAMDILYTGHVDGFVLVSSDSDFTRLASRIRESGLNVIGMGESKTPNAFVTACNSFKYLDIIYHNQQMNQPRFEITRDNKANRDKKSRFTPKTDLDTALNSIRSIIKENSNDDNWMSLADLGNHLAKRYPDFDVRNFGHYKLASFIESLGDEFELKRRSNGEGYPKPLYVRIK